MRFLPSCFPINTLYAIIFFPIRATFTAHLIDLITVIIFHEEYVSAYIITLLTMQFSPASSYFLRRSSKCLPRHAILGLSGFVMF